MNAPPCPALPHGVDVTRLEINILRAYAMSISQALGPCVKLVQYGSGSGVKARLLLEALESPAAYVPVEICGSLLRDSVAGLRAAFPGLHIAARIADFTLPLPREHDIRAKRTIVFFSGSTLGNLEPADALALLCKIRQEVGNAGGAIAGVDLHKPVAHSHQDTLDGFATVARQAGLRLVQAWTDPRRRVAVVYLESVPKRTERRIAPAQRPTSSINQRTRTPSRC